MYTALEAARRGFTIAPGVGIASTTGHIQGGELR